MLHFLIRFGLHLLILYALWLIISALLDKHLKKSKKHLDFKYQSRLRSIGEHVTRYNRAFGFIDHLDRLLFLTSKNYESGVTVSKYLIQSIFVSAAVFAGSALTLGNLPNMLSTSNPFDIPTTINDSYTIQWELPLLLAVLVVLINYLFLVSKFKRTNIQSSFDLIEVVKVMSKFTSLSIDGMLERTSDMLPEKNVLKRPLMHLAHVFLTYGNAADLYREANRFSQLIGTTFATQLVQDLLYAERESNNNLSNSLLRLFKAMQDQREVILTVKSNSKDAIQFGFYVNLIVFVVLVGCIMWYLTPSVYLKLQFGTQSGVIMLSIILIGFISSFFISVFLSKPKLDYH